MTVDKSSPGAGSLAAFARLQEIVATLRGDQGCPWDRKQTLATMSPYLLEECRELAEAIDSNEPEAICEEIGDVFFILTMLATILGEEQRGSAARALELICSKMIRRHPHVFEDVTVHDEEELHRQWQRIKDQEKQTPPAHPV